MAIVRKKVVAAQTSTSTHFPNLEKRAAEAPAAEVLNHQEANLLIDPPEAEGGSTHFKNEETDSPKSRAMNASKAKPVKAAKKIKADMDEFEGEDPDSIEDTGEDAFTGVDVDAELNEEGEDPQFLPNDTDPAEGYLTVGNDEEGEPEDVEDEAIEDEDEELPVVDIDEEEVTASDELEHGSNPTSLLEVEDDDEGGDTHFQNLTENTPETRAIHAGEDEEDEEDEENSWGAESDDSSTYKASLTQANALPLVDVDGMPDSETDDVAFATVGLRVHAMKGNRIIASIGKKAAVQAGHGDVYMSDEFQDVVGVEMAKHGLRAGLKSMGFSLATVNVAAVEVVNKRVEAKVKVLTAAVRRNAQANTESFEQCAAIAAVGINRQFFKDTHNELRAALIDEFEAAGVRRAANLVRQVFAKHGVSYAKAIITLATQLQGMPETARNSIAAALDMTSENPEGDEDLYGDGASPDFQSEYCASDEDAEFADEFDEEVESPSSVTAALSRPLRRTQISATKTNYSVTAAAILSGDAPFPY